MGVGFLQSLYALDAADGESGGGEIVINGLIQALLGQVTYSRRDNELTFQIARL